MSVSDCDSTLCHLQVADPTEAIPHFKTNRGLTSERSLINEIVIHERLINEKMIKERLINYRPFYIYIETPFARMRMTGRKQNNGKERVKQKENKIEKTEKHPR